MRPSASLLLVDDLPENLMLLQTILEPLGQHLVLASSGEDALREMLRHDFAAVLLDVRMPGMDGYETATLMKSRERTRHVPIIFLTANDPDEVSSRRGYDVGAVDYLYKPFDPVVLRSKVEVFIDLHHLKREAQELAHRALHDPLTALPNRTLFVDRLELALTRLPRVETAVGVFFIDLDGFKPVNDTRGHDAGDKLLRDVGEKVRAVLRPSDTIARLGGDEFAVLSDAVADTAQAQRIAGRIVAAVAETEVTASVGVALAREPVSAQSLTRAADTAMYVAKSAGGNGWRLAAATAAAT